jgi:hypothetical protein
MAAEKQEICFSTIILIRGMPGRLKKAGVFCFEFAHGASKASQRGKPMQYRKKPSLQCL